MKFQSFVYLFIVGVLLALISAQDSPAPGQNEITEAPPPPVASSTYTNIQPSSTTPAVVSKEPEETTPIAPADPSLGPPHFHKNIFKWTQYRQFRNGKCFECGCLQYKHYRDTCECFNNYLHAKANLMRRMYIKKSPWSRCQPLPVAPLKRRRIDK